MSAIAQHWPLALAITGVLLAMTGTAAVTWLAASVRGDRWRRRALRAEEALARLRRQRRQPLTVLPGLFPTLERAEADTVLMHAITPRTGQLLGELGRRSR